MTASETYGGDEVLTSTPRNRMKFLCSYGGKILPRSSDGKLKYVGGETRMVAVPGDIKFSELMKKVNSMVEGDMILKFLIIPDELDALVTVKSDEDVKHIVDEYRRLESEGTPKLRAFLFPSSPIIVENQMSPAIEQRYIEAINGIVRHSSNSSSGRLTPVNRMSNFSISAWTSSKSGSPDPCPFPIDSSIFNRPPMPKVRSSPSLYSLSTLHPQNNNHSNHQVYQPHHHYNQNQQQPQPYSVQSARTLHGPHDFARGAMGHSHVPMNRVDSVSRHNSDIVRSSSNSTSGRLTPVNPMSNFSISACTSPKSGSPDPCPFPIDPSIFNGNQLNKPPMPKVRSSPSLYSLSTLHPQNNNLSDHQVYHQQQPYSVQSARTSPGPHDFARGAMGHSHVR